MRYSKITTKKGTEQILDLGQAHRVFRQLTGAVTIEFPGNSLAFAPDDPAGLKLWDDYQRFAGLWEYPGDVCDCGRKVVADTAKCPDCGTDWFPF